VDILINMLIYLIKITFDLYILAIILRILIQLVKVDHDAPLKEFVFNLTDIPLKLISKIIPKIGRFDTGAILLIILLKILELSLMDIVTGKIPHINGLIIWTSTSLLTQILNLYFYLILFQIFLGWLTPQHRTRAINTLNKLTCPLLKPLRKMIPSIAGFDLTPVVALILLQLITIAVIGPLTQLGMRLTFGMS
jgi:YggT family protein